MFNRISGLFQGKSQVSDGKGATSTSNGKGATSTSRRVKMKTSAALLFLLFASAFNYGQRPAAQPTQVRAVFGSFHQSLRSLNKNFNDKSASGMKGDIARSLESINENVKFLEAVMNLGKPIPREYLDGLSLDAQLLEKLAKQESGTACERQALCEGLREVQSDLLLKVAGPRSGGEVTRLVEVIVRARKGNQDVPAYQVWYVAKGWANDSSKFKPFDRLTDPSKPSSKKLAPGNYFIWLNKGGATVGRQPASIGENGETRREIELPVP